MDACQQVRAPAAAIPARLASHSRASRFPFQKASVRLYRKYPRHG